MVQVKERGGGNPLIHSFELSGKEIFFNYDEMKSKEEKNKKEREQKEGTSRAERTIQVMVEAVGKTNVL